MVHRPSPTTEYAATDTVAEILEHDDEPDECIIFRPRSEADGDEGTAWVSARGDWFVPLDAVR